MKIPFTPAVYEHAARFVGRSPAEVSRDAELLYQAHRGACLEYRHQSQLPPRHRRPALRDTPENIRLIKRYLAG